MTVFRVFRHTPGETAQPKFVDYTVETPPGTTVLDGLFRIKHETDGTLAFRSSCRSAICGSCAMNINGVNRLACNTQAADLGGLVRVEPLPGYAVFRDLVVNLEPFWQQYRSVKPYLQPRSPPPAEEWYQSWEERRILESPGQCIMCAACTSACPVAWTDPRYLGPAALVKVWRYVADSRDGAREERLASVNNEGGLWRCHTIFRCVDACPKHIHSTDAIMRMRRAVVRSALGGRRGG
jgi:succinate dehydrogenase / fumarate reductase iron-sulfur subunit